jgi:hypothetical protein
MMKPNGEELRAFDDAGMPASWSAGRPTVEIVRNVIQAACDGVMSAQSAAEVMFSLFRREIEAPEMCWHTNAARMDEQR